MKSSYLVTLTVETVLAQFIVTRCYIDTRGSKTSLDTQLQITCWIMNNHVHRFVALFVALLMVLSVALLVTLLVALLVTLQANTGQGEYPSL
jgi:hypothetical protein